MKPLRLSSVRMRMTLWNVGVLACVLAILGGTLHYMVQANLTRSVDRDLTERAHRSRRFWEWTNTRRPVGSRSGSRERPTVPGTMPPSPAAAPDNRGGGPRPASPFRPKVLTLEGREYYSRRPDTPWDAQGFAAASQGQERSATVEIEGEPVRVHSVPLYRNGVPVGVVQVRASLADIRHEIDRLGFTLLSLVPVALLIAGAGGAFLTDRALRPVREITQTASQIRARNLSGRLPVKGSDEFSELAATFNGMLGRLEEAFTQLEQAYDRERRFTADASHELRTPLTIIKANTSLALRGERTAAEYRKALEAADRAADMTNQIVQDMLLLARSDGGQLGQNPETVPVPGVLERAVEAVRTTRRGAPIHLEPIPDTLFFFGNESELTRVFLNLLDNAARHTPANTGRITVAVSATKEKVTVTVTDTGEGIPAEHLPHVTDRFYRVDAARARAHGGTGLGLAICKSIVEAHDGTLALDSTVGEGTTVYVALPRAATEPAEEEEATAA